MTDQPTNPNEFILIVAYTPLRTNSNKSFKSQVSKTHLISLTTQIKVGPATDLMPKDRHPIETPKTALCVIRILKTEYALIYSGNKIEASKLHKDKISSLSKITSIDAMAAEHPHVFAAQGSSVGVYYVDTGLHGVHIGCLSIGCRQTYGQGRYSAYGRGLVYRQAVLYCLGAQARVVVASMAKCFDWKNAAVFDSAKVEIKEVGNNVEHFDVRDSCLVTVDGKVVSLYNLEFTSIRNVKSVKEKMEMTLPDSDAIWYATIGISESCIIVGGSSTDRSDKFVKIRTLNRKTLQCIDYLEFKYDKNRQQKCHCPHQISFIYHKKSRDCSSNGSFSYF